jgi:hypothetical protein
VVRKFACSGQAKPPRPPNAGRPPLSVLSQQFRPGLSYPESASTSIATAAADFDRCDFFVPIETIRIGWPHGTRRPRQLSPSQTQTTSAPLPAHPLLACTAIKLASNPNARPAPPHRGNNIPRPHPARAAMGTGWCRRSSGCPGPLIVVRVHSRQAHRIRRTPASGVPPNHFEVGGRGGRGGCGFRALVEEKVAVDAARGGQCCHGTVGIGQRAGHVRGLLARAAGSRVSLRGGTLSSEREKGAVRDIGARVCLGLVAMPKRHPIHAWVLYFISKSPMGSAPTVLLPNPSPLNPIRPRAGGRAG